MRFMSNKTFSPGVSSGKGLESLEPYVKRLRFKASSAHLPALYTAFFMQNVKVNKGIAIRMP
jgi:hypothetical protein